MKNRIIPILSLCLMFSVSGCNKFLELESLEKVSTNQILESEGGLKSLLANLYSAMPMEDFNYRPNTGFNQRGWAGVDYILMTSFLTDESSRSDGLQGIGPWDFLYWPYDKIREVSLFFEYVEIAKTKGTINADQAERLKSEAHFIRGYIYFGLAKRYGGVPLIDKAQDNIYNPGGDNSALNVPRSTEKETWDFVLKELDLAVVNMPTTVSGEDGPGRATKWAAYGLKSRAALHAASIAKYWNNAPLGGEAASKNLVGMSPSDAANYYTQSMEASKTVIDNSGKSLFMASPATVEEAKKNLETLFTTAPSQEVIFAKYYLDGTTVGNQGHNFDIYYSPSQGNPGFHKFGRFNPTLDIVDLYEDYTDNGTGISAKIITRLDGNESDYILDPKTLNVNIPFKKYDNLYEPFKNKDARLLASVIVPGSTFKNNPIIMQGGMIKADGSVIAYADGNEVGKDGKRYYAFGAESTSGFSGFFGMGRSDDANYSSTGFSIRKFLQESKTILGLERSSSTTFIDMRLAEFYLNYAEAAVESGTGDLILAANYINALRKRAGHKDNIEPTLANILKERQVELAFEGFRYWDLIRRREYHTLFDTKSRKALVPMIDLREAQPKYIFVRANYYYDQFAGGRTFQPRRYYLPIPGRNTNNLIENPEY